MTVAFVHHSLADRLHAALAAQGIAAAALARRCGLSKQNLHRFLTGQVIRSKHLPIIARELGVSLSWLAVGDQSTAPGWWVSQHPIEAPPPDRTANETWRPSWRIQAIIGDGGRPIADDGDLLIIDTALAPAPGSLILLPSPTGARLRRHGGTVSHQVVLAGIDRGHGLEIVRASQLAHCSVVVGIVFASSRSGQGA
jgi:transcriptional regulator with XRE-family HTH domain